jgi:hypothetical protein
VRYTPPDSVRSTRCSTAPHDANGLGEMAAPVDRCAAVATKPRVTVTLAQDCASATFRVAPRLLRRYAINEPAFAVGSSAVMAYIGYYAAVLLAMSCAGAGCPTMRRMRSSQARCLLNPSNGC